MAAQPMDRPRAIARSTPPAIDMWAPRGRRGIAQQTCFNGGFCTNRRLPPADRQGQPRATRRLSSLILMMIGWHPDINLDDGEAGCATASFWCSGGLLEALAQI